MSGNQVHLEKRLLQIFLATSLRGTLHQKTELCKLLPGEFVDIKKSHGALKTLLSLFFQGIHGFRNLTDKVSEKPFFRTINFAEVPH